MIAPAHSSVAFGDSRAEGERREEERKRGKGEKGNAESISSLKGVDVPLDLPGMDECVVSLPFQQSQAHDILEDMLA